MCVFRWYGRRAGGSKKKLHACLSLCFAKHVHRKHMYTQQHSRSSKKKKRKEKKKHTSSWKKNFSGIQKKI